MQLLLSALEELGTLFVMLTLVVDLVEACYCSFLEVCLFILLIQCKSFEHWFEEKNFVQLLLIWIGIFPRPSRHNLCHRRDCLRAMVALANFLILH